MYDLWISQQMIRNPFLYEPAACFGRKGCHAKNGKNDLFRRNTTVEKLHNANICYYALKEYRSR